MPWKIENGVLQLSGKLGDWMKDINGWYQQDTGNSLRELNLDMYHQYLYLLAVNYSIALDKKWREGVSNKSYAEQLIVKDNLERLTALFSPNSQGAANPDAVNVWDVLDYLADNMDEGLRNSHMHQARQFATEKTRQFLGR